MGSSNKVDPVLTETTEDTGSAETDAVLKQHLKSAHDDDPEAFAKKWGLDDEPAEKN